MKLWLIGLSTAALAGAMPSPLQARQNLKTGQSKCTCEKWGDALKNPNLEELCDKAGGVVETNKLGFGITEYFCIADSSAGKKTFTTAACASYYGKDYESFCFDPVVCNPRTPPCSGNFGGLGGVNYYCYGSKLICSLSGYVSAPAGDCYDACCGGGKPGDTCYHMPPVGPF